MIKLLAVAPIRWDATSFYRAFGVFPNLERQMNRELMVIPFQGNRFTWAELGAIDICFFQRPARVDDLKLANYVKSLGVKVWVDYDDNLFALPNESGAYFEYSDDVRRTMMKLLLTADVITVSTQELKDFFLRLIDINQPGLEADIRIVPNALNDDWLKPSEYYNKDSKIVVWRGSQTHWYDIVAFTDQLYDVIETSPDEYHFMGYNPATLTNFFGVEKKVFPHKGEDPMIYWENLKYLKPKVMHIPLVDNALNRAKSNIAWIEATYAGAVTIAPNWPEWNRPGVLRYNNPEEYKMLLTNPTEDYPKRWRDSMDYIKENLLLSTVNKARIEIIKQLTEL